MNWRLAITISFIVVFGWLTIGPVAADAVFSSFNGADRSESCVKVVKKYNQCGQTYRSINKDYQEIYNFLHYPRKVFHALFGNRGVTTNCVIYEKGIPEPELENGNCNIQISKEID